MESSCCVCGRNDVRLVDAIIENEVKKICEKCASVDDSIVPVNKPSEQQLKEADRPFTVYERLRRMARMKIHEDEFETRERERRKEAQVNLTKLAAVKSDKEFMQKQEERKQLNLAEDFNEQIQNARNLKGISQQQLAESIAEPEENVRLLERGIMPQNADNIIKKAEQYLHLDLRKKPEEKKQEQRAIDFKSGGITVGDLKKMREEMFGSKEDN